MFKRNLLIILIAIPFLSGCVAAVATTAIVGSDIAANRRSAGSYLDDQSIELQSSKLISRAEALKESSNISVTSYNRVVLLVGQTPNEQLRAAAADIVRKIDNVRKIHNEIRVTEENSFMDSTKDSWITTKAKSLMLAEKNFASGNIKVVTENAELFLMGLVTRSEADKAIAIVRDIIGVKRVVQAFEYISKD